MPFNIEQKTRYNTSGNLALKPLNIFEKISPVISSRELAVKRLTRTAPQIGLLDLSRKEPVSPLTIGEAVELIFSQKSKEPEAKKEEPFSEIKAASDLGQGSSLENTGFDLPAESKRFIGSYNEARAKGKSHEQAVMSAYYELDANIRTFAREFIKGGLVLPMLIDEKDGQIVNSYDGIRVVSKITGTERNGAPLEASENLETFFAENKGEVMTIINSPMGWTGYKNEKGQDTRYGINQTLVIGRNGQGVLWGMTLVSDMKLEQAQEFMVSLGAKRESLDGATEQERIVNMIKSPLEFKGSERVKKPDEIIDAILAVRGMGDFRLEQADGTIEYRPVSEMKKDVLRIGGLLKFDTETEGLLAQLKDPLIKRGDNLADYDTQREIAKYIEAVVLGITATIIRDEKNEKSGYQKPVGEYQPVTFNNLSDMVDWKREKFEKEVAFLKTRAGCSKGVSSSLSAFGSSLSDILSPDSGIVSGIGGGVDEGGKCKICKKSEATKGGCGYCDGCASKAA